jgi:transcriptional regulator GlxA family with amidase domain
VEHTDVLALGRLFTSGHPAVRLEPDVLFVDDGDVLTAAGNAAALACAQRQAPAILAAHASASSRETTSTTTNPPMTSLVYG